MVAYVGKHAQRTCGGSADTLFLSCIVLGRLALYLQVIETAALARL